MTTRTRLRPSTLALALCAALPTLALAAPGTGSAYLSDRQNTHVQDSTSQGIDQVNMITCVMSSMRPDALVNQGNYAALIDRSKCDPQTDAGNTNANGGSTTGSATYMTALTSATRTSDSEPMRVKAWIDDQESGAATTIFASASVSAAPDDTHPYGAFRLDYCGVASGSASCQMQGYLDAASDGIRYFETDAGGSTSALRLQTANADSGQGRMQIDGGPDGSAAFSFAYNADYFLRHTDGLADQCFTRDASDAAAGVSVWSYGLYRADTGERVERNTNFTIEYTDADGHVHRGGVGYDGLWTEGNVDVPDGATVQRVTYQSGAQPTRTPYTLMKAPGRLMKYTLLTRKLAQLDGVEFQAWVGDATHFYPGARSNLSYLMYWDDAAGDFKVTGEIDCDSGPCMKHMFDTPQAVAASFFFPDGGIRGRSDAMAGNIFIPLPAAGSVDSSAIDVAYRKEEIVYPGGSDMPATLYCVTDCPTAATVAAYYAAGSTAASPYMASTHNNWMTSASGLQRYTMDTARAVMLDDQGQVISMTSMADLLATQNRPPYQAGVFTGWLVADPSSLLCADGSGNYCESQAEQAPVYYQWQTSPFSQLAALKDANGRFVSFDAPLEVTYTVPTGAHYGQYAGKSIVLEYKGFGQLLGIPERCVSSENNAPVSCDQPGSRSVPAFAIPYDQVNGVVHDGGTPLLVKWLDREVRFATRDVAVCTAAGVALPGGLTLPDASGLQNPTDPASPVYIGDKPAVTDAPRVVDGVVKY
jgi:hypothetical protein